MSYVMPPKPPRGSAAPVYARPVPRARRVRGPDKKPRKRRGVGRPKKVGGCPPKCAKGSAEAKKWMAYARSKKAGAKKPVARKPNPCRKPRRPGKKPYACPSRTTCPKGSKQAMAYGRYTSRMKQRKALERKGKCPPKRKAAPKRKRMTASASAARSKGSKNYHSFVRSYRARNPHLSYREAQQEASDIYTPSIFN